MKKKKKKENRRRNQKDKQKNIAKYTKTYSYLTKYSKNF